MPEIPQEVIEKIKQRDLQNIAKQAGDGRPLTEAQLARLNEARTQPPANDVTPNPYTCGRCLFDVEQTAILLGVPDAEICEGAVAADYMRGRLEGLLRIRQRLFDEADAGDMAAVKQYLQIYTDTEPEIDEPEK